MYYNVQSTWMVNYDENKKCSRDVRRQDFGYNACAWYDAQIIVHWSGRGMPRWNRDMQSDAGNIEINIIKINEISQIYKNQGQLEIKYTIKVRKYIGQ